MAIIYGRAESKKQLLDKYPKTVQSIDDIDRVHQEIRRDILTELEDGIFVDIKKQNKKRQINKFEKNKDDPLHAGDSGELQVIDILSQLPDEYHILCGVNLQLPKYVTYNGKKNLKSAQMDFVVISKK